MDAESSGLAMGDRALPDELDAVLAAFEQVTGLMVCIRPMSDAWRDVDGRDVIPAHFTVHRSPFCSTVKAKLLAACMRCDSSDLPAACNPPQGRIVQPFVRTCHAGADEVLTPLWSEGMLTGVLFVGQFRRMAGDGTGVSPLRQLEETDVERIRTLALTLRTYLLDVLRQLHRRRQGSVTGRRGAIEAYIHETLSTGPTLAGLASRLALSPSRAGHVVRETTGRSFQELVTERRIAVAKDLLTSSDGTVTWVAHQTGFEDIAYFSRWFKQRTGTSPSSFRAQYARITSV